MIAGYNMDYSVATQRNSYLYDLIVCCELRLENRRLHRVCLIMIPEAKKL
jgi:hypothetical protein